MRKLTKRAVTIGACTAILGGAGVAYAAWYAISDPTPAVASASRLQPVAVVGDVAIATPLYPGGSSDVVFTVQNPNAYDVTVIEANADRITSGTRRCETRNVSFARADLTQAVAGNGTAVITLEDAVTMREDAPEQCQDAQFTLQLRVTSRVGQEPAGPGPRR